MAKGNQFKMYDFVKALNAIKKTAPELKELAEVFIGPKLDPEELFNRAVVLVRQAVYNDPYYILGISKDDTEELAEAVFKVKAKYYHPDTGGSNEKFARLNDAWSRIRREKGW